MSEKNLKAAISVIPTVIFVVCVVAAFATHDWDLQATILGENSLQALERFFPAELAGEEELLKVSDLRVSVDDTRLVLKAVLHSPLNVPVTIKEMQAEIVLEGSTVAMHLPEEVTIPAQGSASVTLEGSLPEVKTPSVPPSPEELTLDSMAMTLDIGGIEVKLEASRLGGAG